MKDMPHSIKVTAKMIFIKIAESLACSRIHISSEETNTTVVEKFRVGELQVDQSALSNALTQIYQRDSFSISFAYADSDVIDSFSTNNDTDIRVFCERLKLQVEEEI